MSSVLSNNSSAVYVRPSRSIGGIVLDVTVSEQHQDELEITSHPVEQGAEITDHAFAKPATVSIEAGHSDSGGSSTGDSRAVEAYEALLKLQDSREPFDLVTGKRAYTNMLIRSLAVTTDKATEHVLSVRAELQEVKIATVQTVSVPKSRQKHAARTASPSKTGQKQVKAANSSGLRQLFGG
ncbi:phage baseplate protein [Pseudodesulfovibrio sp.]|uniref:phage baseplate protein n=1 Tax=Pseudodesulfovibrio sp. TaxID=2035812 RepID=UPI002608FF07|nr:hypothetical protein [Pseudodesulfovibrio sp.]MDD3310948.1 hypothetical protein [Pseudodesulfovibrio sp.]